MIAESTMAQFPPQVGIAGSTAIPHNSPDITAWASGCVITRGYLDIAQPGLGRVFSGEENMGTGPADNQVVSLGDSGVAVLTFPGFIVNGPGADFAVFENGFLHPQDPEQAYLELAFVEVSSDGINFTRFPASCHVQDTHQIAGAGEFINAREIHNLAGKYRSRFGTPFDLEELAGTPGLDINRITHVRIVDVVGSLDETYGSKDKDGNRINDPYPTPYDIGTGGFDLDAVGVIHQQANGVQQWDDMASVRVYPNPVSDRLFIKAERGALIAGVLMNPTGSIVQRLSFSDGNYQIDMQHLPVGIYYLTLEFASAQKQTICISKS